jgi:hypothetical protein
VGSPTPQLAQFTGKGSITPARSTTSGCSVKSAAGMIRGGFELRWSEATSSR